MQHPQLPGVVLLGDPHLGKAFKTGTPPHRMGDRDKIQFDTFKQSLLTIPDNTHLHVCMGDLFDRPHVPESLVLRVYRTYKQACAGHPDTTFVLIEGNHDASRDASKASSFDVLAHLLDGIPNMVVVQTDPQIVASAGQEYLFVPWVLGKDAEEVVAHLPSGCPFAAVFGHWDLDNFKGAEDLNVLPYETLSKVTDVVVTGHIHIAENRTYGDMLVIGTGSMLPCSHAEDPLEELYVTRSRKTVLAALEEKPDVYFNHHLRVELEPHEDPLAGIDCLSLTHKRVAAEGLEDVTTQVDDFDLKTIFFDVMAEEGVTPDLTDELWKQL
ncbi:metallophosphoesterase [Oceanimonas pelagia]|uniref:Metallophosphoesterase n=1 Tax=Oceanimonas pelagia TaxID=3028314 RepID=A0AA50KM13_9GAMM|nr:metallophosphoesterase [Oceanimonas pelagia]WMC09573.1 metallophosphoesterase [Oceanimonas pelagia]